jgi:sporadic carbohydrate cluster 2OG-Fe(II) oxygenase
VSFLRAAERRVCDNFLRNGYVVAPAEDRAALDRIRDFVVARTVAIVDAPANNGAQQYLDTIAQRLDPSQLNDVRLRLMDDLLAEDWFRPAYFRCARGLLETLIGNELAMQRGLGLSIQLPNDDSSLQPLHSDVWSEDSPFELVLWIPLVDCVRTKSLFLLPPEADARWRPRMRDFASAGVNRFFNAVESEIHWMELHYGEVLVFTHTLMHGNRVNLEPTARWSMNVRFKSLFSPYSDKQLGDFFEPIVVRPATRIGMTYELPGGFDGT